MLSVTDSNLMTSQDLGCLYSLDWTTGLDYWTGLLDWTAGTEYCSNMRLDL